MYAVAVGAGAVYAVAVGAGAVYADDPYADAAPTATVPVQLDAARSQQD